MDDGPLSLPAPATACSSPAACPACGAAGTLSETIAERASGHRYAAPVPAAVPVPLAEIETRELGRVPSGIGELDRVLGGGLVAGQVVLLAGDPGIGKSTLLLQCVSSLKSSSLYISGEESAEQIALRARRLALPAGRVRLLAEIQLERIVAALEAERPQVAVIDSIQTLYSDQMQSAPGSVAQVRECAAQLTRFAKRSGTALLLIGHVTKEGAIAGPRVLEHIVDTVLHFEGDPHSAFRLVRAIKNRFGAVNELGVFGMTEKGLRAVSNPSALFLSQHERAVAGSCVLATLEGTRPLLVEIQALVAPSSLGSPRRAVVGWDAGRLAILWSEGRGFGCDLLSRRPKAARVILRRERRFSRDDRCKGLDGRFSSLRRRLSRATVLTSATEAAYSWRSGQTRRGQWSDSVDRKCDDK